MHRPSRAVVGLVMLLHCTAATAAAQGGGLPPAFDRLFIGADPRLAVLSNAQLDVLKRSLAIDINTFPTESAAVSFAKPFNLDDPKQSYGPLYLLHSAPLNPGTIDAFVAFRRTSWTRLDDIDLDAGRLTNRIPAFLNRPSFDSAVSMRVTSETLTGVAHFGLTGTVTLAVAVPLQRVCVSGSREAIVNPGAGQTIEASACGTGLGDAQVSAKFSREVGSYWLAGDASLSLATGDADELRGKGQTQPTLMVAVTRPHDRLQPHVNAGVTLGGHGVQFAEVDFFGVPAFIIERVSPSRRFNYGAGVDVVVSPRVTLNVEVVGRMLRHGVDFAAVDVLNGSSLVTTPVAWQPFVLASVGTKIRLRDGLMLNAHVARQMSRSGLRTPLVIGFALEHRLRDAK